MNSYNPDFISNEVIKTSFSNFNLQHFNLRPIGYDINLFAIKLTIVIDFIIEQYSLATKKHQNKISAGHGETILDLGACWGDTSLYFADKVGEEGKVYAFEFIPSNLKIIEKNLDLNPRLKNRIHIIPNPVSMKGGDDLFFIDNGPASQCKTHFEEGFDGPVHSVSIDDFVNNNSIKSVDLIKMDIEGAELNALKGAEETIKRFRPKLMIALYHSIDDFINIPNFLLSLDLDYSFHLGHFTIHSEETILFAVQK